MKRYSTVTMGPCQGKMCHGLASRVHAGIAGASPAQTGLTTARPPFQPVTLAALAGPHLSRIRRTAMHQRHDELGATWIDMGDWKRPLHYGDLAGRVPGRPRGGRDHRRQHPRHARRPGLGRGRVPRLAAPESLQRPQGGPRPVSGDAGRRRDHPRRRRGRPPGAGAVLRVDDDRHPGRGGPVAGLVAGRRRRAT